SRKRRRRKPRCARLSARPRLPRRCRRTSRTDIAVPEALVGCPPWSGKARAGAVLDCRRAIVLCDGPLAGGHMADHSKDPASAEFKKAQRAADGKNARAEYEAAGAAMRAKTERLRALRLARDAGAPPGPRKPAAGSKSKTKKKQPAAKLADWLASQERSGRKT